MREQVLPGARLYLRFAMPLLFKREALALANKLMCPPVRQALPHG